MVTDQGGNIVWQWDNTDPYGDSLPNQDPNGTGNQFVFNLRFPGQYFDVETGLFQNWFRDYDPATGRFPQSDPLGLKAGQFSTYAYVGNNPLNSTDPNGLQSSSQCGNPANAIPCGEAGMAPPKPQITPPVVIPPVAPRTKPWYDVLFPPHSRNNDSGSDGEPSEERKACVMSCNVIYKAQASACRETSKMNSGEFDIESYLVCMHGADKNRDACVELCHCEY